jgi:hypothetical protein
VAAFLPRVGVHTLTTASTRPVPRFLLLVQAQGGSLHSKRNRGAGPATEGACSHSSANCTIKPHKGFGYGLERRGHRRFDLQVQIQFNWKDPKGVRHLGSGRTRDISTGGMFVYTDSLPPQDAEVQTMFSFPASSLVAAGVQMATKARVLRLEPAEPGKAEAGFALVSHSFALRRQRSNRIA